MSSAPPAARSLAPAAPGRGAADGDVGTLRGAPPHPADSAELVADGELVALVQERGPAPGRRHPLRGPTATLGRAPTCDVHIDHPDVSRSHAALLVAGDGLWVDARGSKNGAQIDGEPVLALQQLRDGQRLQIGEVCLRLDYPSARTLRADAGVTATALRRPHRAPAAIVDGAWPWIGVLGFGAWTAYLLLWP